VYNGVDIMRFSYPYSEAEKEQFRTKVGLRNGQVVGIIARLSPVKGHKYLLAAMREVVNLKPHAQLLIVGEGPLKEELFEQTMALGLKENVVFLGSTFDTAIALSVIDIFALPSLQEGLGLSIMEAQAAGVPVIASNVGGIYTIIKDRENGLLIPPKDSLSLTQAIIELMDNPKLAKKMGEKGREVIRENFSLDEMTERIEKLYIQCVKE
jgi:glycosyltransferase involved in cell wall biosynthesis